MSETARPLIVWTTCHPWIQQVVNEIRPEPFDVEFLDLADPAATAEVLPRADFIVCLSLSSEQVAMLERCQLVMHNGVGYDAIDLAALQERGIPVAVTPAMTAEGVSEHVFMTVLAISRQLPAVQASMRAGEWNMLGWREGSHNIAYKTFGIVGLGRIGSRVARLAHAFGCRVLYTDIVNVDPELEQQYELTRVGLDELIAESDILTAHVPLTDSTVGMFGEAEFFRMKPGAIFVNASRGPVADLGGLTRALEAGHLRGAGIDVYDPEPPSADLGLLQMPNVVCTPHIASGTVERQYSINRAQFTNAQRVLDGLEPENRIA